MSYQNINASLSPEDIKAIKDAFALITEKMPFPVELTVKERRSTFKAESPIACHSSKTP
uniref:Uncharacterized protein n=1 Tax=Candidatus Kentrum sp. LPFa TaxID=2126335 RepID=A0A450X863_9GAMM|nr:MAG: hypothetical protein BECKLPF1236A_GA0070988_101484 [Candidatus Kentron sp. LPFa]VFK25400.1 MAG: hypothetical protein BECKLPF1236C_GA0070990_100219 [Candidatus Kentron sp. LPFa]